MFVIHEPGLLPSDRALFFAEERRAMPHTDVRTFAPVELSVPLYMQETDVWCWAAAARMVIAYYRGEGETPPQARLVELILDLPEGHCQNSPMPAECVEASESYFVAMLMRIGGARQVREVSALDALGVYAALDQRNVIVAEMRTGEELTHVIVIRGVWVRDKAAFEIDVLVNDPSPLVTEPIWIPYAELAPAIERLFIVYGSVLA